MWRWKFFHVAHELPTYFSIEIGWACYCVLDTFYESRVMTQVFIDFYTAFKTRLLLDTRANSCLSSIELLQLVTN